jgi:hypothetical protein
MRYISSPQRSQSILSDGSRGTVVWSGVIGRAGERGGVASDIALNYRTGRAVRPLS